MWLWDDSPRTDEILSNTNGVQDALFAFLAAPHNEPSRNINRLFFEARRHYVADRYAELGSVTYDSLTPGEAADKLRAFLRRAHNDGIAVEYLDGNALWLATDDYAEVPKQICRDVVAFNEAAPDPDSRFDGLHLDIEPHTVKSGPYAGVWWQNRLPGGYNAAWTQRWQEILTSCRQTLDDYEQATGHQMTLSGDFGADFAHYNAPMREFLTGSDAPLDYITLMNYFDNRPNNLGQPSFFYGMSDGSQITGGVVRNLADWPSIPLLFGLETGPPSIAEDFQSFHQEGRAAMNQVIDALEQDYTSSRVLGAAVHHYTSYRQLQE